MSVAGIASIVLVGILVTAVLALYVLVVRGSVTIDIGVGRRIRTLGPVTRRIAAPREIVFDVVAAPYLGKTPRALERKLRVLERGEDMVLAAHFTSVGPVTTTTLETVRFERPERIHFRLTRGPVAHAVEQFALHERDGCTELVYTGELGADFWLAGRIWAYLVARRWEAAVKRSLAEIAAEAERQAGSAAARART